MRRRGIRGEGPANQDHACSSAVGAAGGSGVFFAARPRVNAAAEATPKSPRNLAALDALWSTTLCFRAAVSVPFLFLADFFRAKISRGVLSFPLNARWSCRT